MARYTSDYRSCSKDTYNKFCSTHSSINVTFEDYNKILKTYNASIMDHVLETGEQVKLPHGFGCISVTRKKTQSTFTGKDGVSHIILPIDWVKTKEAGKKVHFFNDHTEGWRYRWIWFKNTSVSLRMKDIWCFKPSREWSQKLCEKLRDPSRKYTYRYSEWEIGRPKKN